MKKAFFVILILVAGVAVFSLSKNGGFVGKNPLPPEESAPAPTVPGKAIEKSDQNQENIPMSDPFQPPLDQPEERVIKKPFGIFITPQNSPVSPEKFRGYHTGTDFEIFPEESDTDVLISAICPGKIIAKRSASGYGGVLVENCTHDNESITVVYGHLKLASISKSTGDQLTVGETIGILGKAFSHETDGERKHLHLGIHKGSSINILGYVQSQAQLSGWLDPCELVCR